MGIGNQLGDAWRIVPRHTETTSQCRDNAKDRCSTREARHSGTSHGRRIRGKLDPTRLNSLPFPLSLFISVCLRISTPVISTLICLTNDHMDTLWPREMETEGTRG